MINNTYENLDLYGPIFTFHHVYFTLINCTFKNISVLRNGAIIYANSNDDDWMDELDTYTRIENIKFFDIRAN